MKMKNNEILSRVKLLMNYEMGKTLEENYKSVNDSLINEDVQLQEQIFRIAGEEIAGRLRGAIDDALVFMRREGGIEIKAADGSLKKATTTAELIDALHNGRVTANTMGQVHAGLLKSVETPSHVIEHLISSPGFQVKFRQVMGNQTPEEMVNLLKQKGYPNETISKMCQKMGIDDSSVYGRNSANQAGHQGQNAANQGGYTPGSAFNNGGTVFRPKPEDFSAIENYMRANYPKLSESQIREIMGKVQGLSNARSLQEFETLGGRMVETQATELLSKKGFNFAGVKGGWLWRLIANNPIKSVIIAYLVAPDIMDSAIGSFWNLIKGRSARAFQNATGLDPSNPGKAIGFDMSGIQPGEPGSTLSGGGAGYNPIKKGEFDN